MNNTLLRRVFALIKIKFLLPIALSLRPAISHSRVLPGEPVETSFS